MKPTPQGPSETRRYINSHSVACGLLNETARRKLRHHGHQQRANDCELPDIYVGPDVEHFGFTKKTVPVLERKLETYNAFLAAGIAINSSADAVAHYARLREHYEWCPETKSYQFTRAARKTAIRKYCEPLEDIDEYPESAFCFEPSKAPRPQPTPRPTKHPRTPKPTKHPRRAETPSAAAADEGAEPTNRANETRRAFAPWPRPPPVPRPDDGAADEALWPRPPTPAPHPADDVTQPAPTWPPPTPAPRPADEEARPGPTAVRVVGTPTSSHGPTTILRATR